MRARAASADSAVRNVIHLHSPLRYISNPGTTSGADVSGGATGFGGGAAPSALVPRYVCVATGRVAPPERRPPPPFDRVGAVKRGPRAQYPSVEVLGPVGQPCRLVDGVADNRVLVTVFRAYVAGEHRPGRHP